jgi:peptidase E
MFYDRFTYTEKGLLDNTHVHFWGLHDFRKQCSQIGLLVKDCDYIYRKTGNTEQIIPILEIDPTLIDMLKKRTYGEVYQYLFVCIK